MMIPERFQTQIGSHLMGNYLEIENYPLILAVIGKPGMGKTWQLREHLNALGIKLFSISSADLESDLAGRPAKLLKDRYVNASISISRGQPSAIVIDDIDTTVGEWENNTGTVNHQGLLAFLMHISDNPYYIEGVGELKRVPIFFTGNNFEKLYEPLRRPVRTKRFEWEPNLLEKAEVLASIFGFSNVDDAKRLIKRYPNESIAFFADFYSSKNIEELSSFASQAALRHIIADAEFKENLYQKYKKRIQNVDWMKYIMESDDDDVGVY